MPSVRGVGAGDARVAGVGGQDAEVTLRVLRAMVTRTETLAVEFGGVRGSSFVGVIDQGSEGRKGAEQLRYVAAVDVVCGACDLCRRGLRQHCQNRATLGQRGRDGAFAPTVRVPRMNLVPVPAAVSDEEALMAQAAALALHACQVVRIEGKTYVTVLGDSAEAILTAQAMARKNASVRLIGQRAERAVLCERRGIKHRLLAEIGRRMDQDIVVDCTGDLSGAPVALELVRPRGTIVVRSDAPAVPSAVMAAQGVRLDLARAAANEVQLIGVRGGSLAEAMGHLERGELDVSGLLQGKFRLAELGHALEAVREAGSLPVSVVM
jgi:threonine dehydrogenase-like Zn-dependent dehydrogenase